MSRRRDPELESIFDREPGLELYARLLGAGRLKPPPLDPGFRHALRRELMTEAYERYQRHSRPGFFATLFSGPRMAAVTVLVGAILVGLLLVTNGNLSGSGNVTIVAPDAARPVAVNQPIVVAFSQPMDRQSVQQAIQIEPATQVTYSWQGNNLVIQPVSGQLAPNTQYHVTVTAAAKTAPGTPIAQPTTVAVTTKPLPSPSPSPAPSPTPTPQPQITAERILAPAGTPVGWSADVATLYYVGGGSLQSIHGDGSGHLTLLASGVSAAALAPDGSKLLVHQGGRLLSLPLPGALPQQQLASVAAVEGLGWSGTRPIYWTGSQGAISFFNAADGAPLGTTPTSADGIFLSPDGTRAVYGANPAVAPGDVPTLYDLTTRSAKRWSQAITSDVAWSPDSTHVAFLEGSSVMVGDPDGGNPRKVLSVADANAEVAWSPSNRLLVVTNSGSWLVNPDGSASQELRQAAIGSSLVWAPGGSRVALVRDGAVWEIEISTTSGASLDLFAAAAVVDAYEKARVDGDSAKAAGLLGPNVSPAPPSPIPSDLHLARYYVISSQATAGDARFTVRLIFAKGKDEVRYQDELLVIVNSAAGLRIDSITDNPPQQLGKGPTVNSVTETFDQRQGSDQVLVVFDSDLDPTSIANSVSILGADGRPVTITTTYSERKLTVAAKLVAGQKYQLVISSGLKDIDGQVLQGGFEQDFTAPGTSGD